MLFICYNIRSLHGSNDNPYFKIIKTRAVSTENQETLIGLSPFTIQRSLDEEVFIMAVDYYGKIQISRIKEDGYVFSDGTACLTELRSSRLLGFHTPSILQNMCSNSWQKALKSFIDKDFICTQTLVEVTAKSHYNSR